VERQDGLRTIECQFGAGKTMGSPSLPGFSLFNISVGIVARRLTGYPAVLVVRGTFASPLAFEEDNFCTDDGMGKEKMHLPRRKAIADIFEGAMWKFGEGKKTL
jgi:hypothetical protein